MLPKQDYKLENTKVRFDGNDSKEENGNGVLARNASDPTIAPIVEFVQWRGRHVKEGKDREDEGRGRLTCDHSTQFHFTIV